MNAHSPRATRIDGVAEMPAVPVGPFRVEAIEGAEWDAMLPAFDDVTFDQSALYAGHRWGTERVLCLAVRDAYDVVVGGATCLIFKLPLLGGLAYVRFGPVWRPTRGVASAEHYSSVVAAIRDHVAGLGLALTLVPRPHPDFTDIEAGELRRLGFTSGLDIVDDRYLVDCSLPAADQMASLAQTWRANLRKSEKAGVEVVELGDGNYDEFEALYARMMTRKSVTLHDPVDVVPALRAHMADGMRPVALLARHDGEAVAGIVYAVAGDVAYYMYGASTAHALPVRAGYALQWAVLERLRGRVRWYDLGGAPDGGLSLHQFKSGLLGKTGRLVAMPGEFNHAPTFRARLALWTILAVRESRRLIRAKLQSLRASRR